MPSFSPSRANKTFLSALWARGTMDIIRQGLAAVTYNHTKVGETGDARR